MALFPCNAGGAGLKETVLWTNPNPTSELAGGSTQYELSASLNNFDYVQVNWRTTTDATIYSAAFKPADVMALTNPTVANAGFTYGDTLGTRVFNAPDDTHVRFGYCYAFASANPVSTRCIPVTVVGLK